MEIKWFVKENTWLERGRLSFGWGNGYVCLPKDHPCYSIDYDSIHDKYQIETNGGLTFSDSSSVLKKWEEIPEGDWWVVGFDTAHSWDTLERWSKESVEFETKKLASQFEEIKKSTGQPFSEFLNEVITDHDCSGYANVKCQCKAGECEERFRDGKLGDNDLEQFDFEALEYFIKFINDGINNIAAINTNMISDVDLENLQALRIMMYNAKNKKLKS